MDACSPCASGRDDPRRAARNTFLIGSGLLFRGETAPGLGWFARGARLLAGRGECAEQARPPTLNAFARMWADDASGAALTFRESAGVAERFDDPDLLTMARLGQGMCLVSQGQGDAVAWDTLGSAFYQLGELHRLRGDFAAAEGDYRQAMECGHQPEPGLALLRLAQGRTEVAVAVLRRAWDWCLGGNPIPGRLVADLTEEQRSDVIQVLDGMVRERSAGHRPTVLTAPLNIGVGTK